MKNLTLCWLTLLACLSCGAAQAANDDKSRIIETSLVSRHLQGNLIGIDPKRSVTVYLPPGYDSSKKSYPVIYYFHSIFWSPRQMFEDGVVKQMLDSGISDKTIGDFIFVVADFTTPNVGTFFGNAPATGRWLDFIVEELVPFVDKNYRTLRQRESRGLMGDAIGGYAALKIAMLFPEHFNVVYALHPYGSAQGLVPFTAGPLPDWRKINQAKSWDDLAGDGRSLVFVAMAQAYLPNPDRPPFYADLMMELKDDELVMNEQHTHALISGFLLDQLVPKYASNLKKLAGIKFDWGRYDPIYDHVYGNQTLTRMLDLYGVEHEADEYSGNQWNKNWIEHGRVPTAVLPFFNRYLVFE